MASERLIEFLKRAEGFSPKAYQDGPRYSIGYGTRARSPDETITREEAERRLREEVNRLEKAIRRMVKVPLAEHELDALISLAYNIGLPRFAASRLLAKLNRGDRIGAAAEFSRWVYQLVPDERGRIKKVELPGLVARRKQERQMFVGLA